MNFEIDDISVFLPKMHKQIILLFIKDEVGEKREEMKVKRGRSSELQLELERHHPINE